MRRIVIATLSLISYVAHAESLPVGIVQCPASECHASLVGPRLIFTNAHCLPADTASCTFTPAQGNSVRLSSNFVTGGGIDEHAKFKGHDWTLVELEEPLGNVLGFFRLHEKEPSENQAVEFYASSQPAPGQRRVFQTSACQVLAPPAWALVSCAANADDPDQASCNFFAHECHVAGAAPSGAPLFIRTGKDLRLIGVHSGRSKLENNSEILWAQTVSPTTDIHANISFHWWTMVNYELLDLIHAHFRGQTISYNQGDDIAKLLAGLILNADRKDFASTIEALRSFSTWQEQWAVYRVLNDVRTNLRQERGRNADVVLPMNYFAMITPTLPPSIPTPPPLTPPKKMEEVAPPPPPEERKEGHVVPPRRVAPREEAPLPPVPNPDL